MSTERFPNLEVALLLFWLLAVIAGCTSGHEVNLTLSDSGKQVQMLAGEVLVISLPSNPSTDYRWEIAEMNEQILSLQGEPQYMEPERAVVGAGGDEIFRFECVGEGQGNLTLIYHRSWESEAPKEMFSLEVVTR